ncbi:N-acetylmuramoyl-L-alanine amidase [Hoeflea prorocentri]|uniref:N-acetylmuramoyl-L-alanine amidase n=1 Tax=Hoeflea prorocentri TaxID=1922333 RepID=A0A9X3UFN8_9HYPH|nr:N-acetylmuramoyl-L-alanine amidase [Hoeflea prorocentri]MCY6379897.1 N-acetylmuramoyl-L-alanine amidase [Hoeflea prorocentri]MDA5397697.1 N-acetylmuramoyl-L-alanine amidase [Hoeflea prorocentri]
MTLERPEFEDATLKTSANFNERCGGPPDMLLLHYTGMDDAHEALDWLCSPQSEVSAHYFVFENGDVVQMVSEEKRAWHAGVSHWKGEEDNNSRSIGIEIANPGHQGAYPDFPEEQIAAVIRLCRKCVDRWAIAPERVLAHSDIAPQRKQDPGEKFPWRSLFETGIGHWVEPSVATGGRFFQMGDAGQPIEALQAMLAMYGYGIEINSIFDERTEAVVRAFQRHFRPSRVDGVADPSTIETLHKLLVALPAQPPKS